MPSSSRHTIWHIPVCPFSQRVEILLERKGVRDEVDIEVLDITQPRPAWLLERTRGSTALPVMQTPDGRMLKESLVLLEYLDTVMPGPKVARSDPYDHALERMLIAQEGAFTAAGYRFVMNQDTAQRDALLQQMREVYARLDDFLVEHAPQSPWLFDDFGLAETVFTPMFMRFWFLEYYEDFALPDTPRFERVRRWQQACLAHPGAQQVSREEIVKLYYDYAKGTGNGALLPGRQRSSFAFTPHWRERSWPPKDKYATSATDAELGLLA